ncbi:ABC transporter ATP-binding protein [Pantoea allii]|uniref:Glutathione import ATP-binding protein GsiA n=1 Tax=Pantoea allii TaxID=574096 RepID=A0A2V2BEM5_9GAMM|nr:MULTISPECIES: ABC transporter ATP-binding protein [Pantoea]MBW1216237.1 ABC transporter ATP-binding protein [Pantoea allii]MBW1259885.1 ABC transporter ATP-binding protein [Pantoea allii]MBW1268985.1 ABC transporter ATP-binding protein [Pantoea allii]MBW1291066.1 ABC transporter ATP-binding protein [Pantoea allii]MCH9298626.1 ABC transporter ATP-binding protein [Pantoea allii]
MINLHNLSVSHKQGYDLRTVVHDVNLQVNAGECFGLVGPSGCGKSSLLWVMAGLNPHWQGEMQLAGHPVLPGNTFTGALRQEVQMVFQDPYASLHPRHRLRRTLAEPLKLLKRDNIADRIHDGFRHVGLDPALADRYPHQLSGGQRQRVAIVRALLLQPKILLLDEPTSALDMSIQAEILNLLNDLKRQDGLTMVLVSHDPDVIDHMCDRAVRMAQGRIVEHIAAPA